MVSTSRSNRIAIIPLPTSILLIAADSLDSDVLSNEHYSEFGDHIGLSDL
jgi:hypothetical protein